MKKWKLVDLHKKDKIINFELNQESELIINYESNQKIVKSLAMNKKDALAFLNLALVSNNFYFTSTLCKEIGEDFDSRNKKNLNCWQIEVDYDNEEACIYVPKDRPKYCYICLALCPAKLFKTISEISLLQKKQLAKEKKENENSYLLNLENF